MNVLVDAVSGIILVAVISLLVRPKSQGPALVSALGSSAKSVLTSAEGSW